MINSAGVIFTYSPNQHQKTQSAGPSLSGNKHLTKKKEPIQQQQIQQKPQITHPAIKHGNPFPQPSPHSQQAPQPLRQPQQLPSRPIRQNPFPPLPLGYKPPLPPYPKLGTRPVSTWDDPFRTPRQRPPSPYAQAKTLQDFMPPAPTSFQPTPQEFHKGLPVEETPEVIHQEHVQMPAIDTKYVDKLFGMKSQDPDKVGPYNKVGPQTQTTVEPIHQTQNVTTQLQPEAETKPEQSSTKETTIQAPVEHIEPEIIPSATTSEELHTSSEITVPSETTSPVIEPEIPTSISHTGEAKPQDTLTPNFSQSHQEHTIQTTEQKEPTTPVSPYMPEGLTAPEIPPSHAQKKQRHFVLPSLFGGKKTSEHIPVLEEHPVPTTIQQTGKTQTGEKQPSQSDVLKPKFSVKKAAGIALIVLAILGLTVPVIPRLVLEQTYAQLKKGEEEKRAYEAEKPLPDSVPLGFNPMMAPNGTIVEPINTEFSIVIPSVGINAPVLAGINPLDSKSYMPALKLGVAHAKTSYFPNQNGSVYLFSHSTNYEWFVNDLNAVFYNVKNLQPGEHIVLFYEGKRYVYEYKESNVVSPKDTAELIPDAGKRELILQTCWPPGSISERLLLYADLVEG
jgi:LPXTG-site transpeptidase (sortase) family protein